MNEYNFDNLSKQEIFSKYLQNLNKLKTSTNTSNHDFEQFLLKHYNKHKYYYNYIPKSVVVKRRNIFILIFTIFISILLTYKTETSNILLRNLQTFIYPGMKIWRKLSIPIITQFPELTGLIQFFSLLFSPKLISFKFSDLYDESCIFVNPFFQVDINCDPCRDIRNVIDANSFKTNILDTPYVFNTQTNPVNLSTLIQIYKNNESIFKREKIQSTNKNIKNFDNLINDFTNKTHQIESHSLYRINRMIPARILRKYLPKMPSNGINLERFLAIDTAQAFPYRIPDCECSNMFVVQAMGSRIITLRPTSECRSKCRTISVKLSPSYACKFVFF